MGRLHLDEQYRPTNYLLTFHMPCLPLLVPQQKLQSYEAQTSPLNEDQKKSLQQKPVLEAIQRELAEISKAFEVRDVPTSRSRKSLY